MAERRWSRGVRVRRGALGGWHENQSAAERRHHLGEVARRDGWTKVVRRLGFLANVANRHDNGKLHRVARADEEWAEEHEHRHRRE